MSIALEEEGIKVLTALCHRKYDWLWDWKRLVYMPVQKKGDTRERANSEKLLQELLMMEQDKNALLFNIYNG